MLNEITVSAYDNKPQSKMLGVAVVDNKKSDSRIKVVEAKKEVGIKGIFGRIKKIRHIEIILAGIAVVVMLAIYFGSNVSLGGGTRNSNASNPSQAENHLQRIERQLNEAFSLLNGAGDTRVIINWESGIEQVIAYIISENQNGSSSAPQVITGGGQQGPIVLKEIYPRAIGVIIVTQGGDNVMLRLAMINAVSTLLDITPDRIQVMTMRN